MFEIDDLGKLYQAIRSTVGPQNTLMVYVSVFNNQMKYIWFCIQAIDMLGNNAYGSLGVFWENFVKSYLVNVAFCGIQNVNKNLEYLSKHAMFCSRFSLVSPTNPKEYKTFKGRTSDTEYKFPLFTALVPVKCPETGKVFIASSEEAVKKVFSIVSGLKEMLMTKRGRFAFAQGMYGDTKENFINGQHTNDRAGLFKFFSTGDCKIKIESNRGLNSVFTLKDSYETFKLLFHKTKVFKIVEDFVMKGVKKENR